MIRLLSFVLLAVMSSLAGTDKNAPPNIIEQTQGQLGTESVERYMEFTADHKGFRVSYKVEGKGPYRLALLKQELDAGGSIVWRQVDILVHNARGNKVGAQQYRNAPAGTYRVQIIGENANYQFAADDPWTKPTSQPGSKPVD